MNRKPRALLIFLALWVLFGAAGCTEGLPEIAATQELVRVAITPAARHTGLAVSTCAATISGASFEVSEVYASQAEADLQIRLGEPQPAAAFAAQIASEELVIVLHPDNTASSLTLNQVQQLFSGNIHSWAELGGEDIAVQVWSLLPADETRRAFIQTVLGGNQLATTASLAPTPEIMAATVASHPAAIGFLPRSWNAPDLTAILPGVSMPVLVVAESEPQGAARELVACLQGEVGQEALVAFFPD
jgi:phosphate transport system substrate-binding protein